MNENITTKQFSVSDFQVKEGSREVICLVSTITVDRDNEVVLPSGLIPKQYNQLPILFDHDWDTKSNGNVKWIKKQDTGILACLHISDATEEANNLYGLIKDDAINYLSAGFLVTDASPPTPNEIAQHPEWENVKNIIREWELLEISFVSVPANPDCVVLAKHLEKEETTIETKAEETPEEENCWQYEEKKINPKEFDHSDDTDNEPPVWETLRMDRLPNIAHADQENRLYPHHHVKGANLLDANGQWANGKLCLNQEGLKCATRKAILGNAPPSVMKHLEAHTKAFEKHLRQPTYCKSVKDIRKELLDIIKSRKVDDYMRILMGKA